MPSCSLQPSLVALVVAIALVVNAKAANGEAPPREQAKKKSSAMRRVQAKDGRAFEFSVVPGPMYNDNLGFAVMGLAIGMYDLYDPRRGIQPSSTELFSLYSTKGSYVLGLNQLLILGDDRFRIDVATGYGALATQFYGIGGTVFRSPLAMKSLVLFGGGTAMVRLFWRIFAGFELMTMASEYRAESAQGNELLEAFGVNTDLETNVSVGPRLMLDTRDNLFNPSNGIKIVANFRGASTALGSKENFGKLVLDYSQYVALTKDKRQVLAWKVSTQTAFGDLPFSEYARYGRRSTLRGYEVGRYVAQQMVAAQVEYRWNFWDRLGAVWFAGIGKVFSDYSQFGDEPWLPDIGTGFRYAIIPERRMNVRVEVAAGKDSMQLYFGVGEAF